MATLARNISSRIATVSMWSATSSLPNTHGQCRSQTETESHVSGEYEKEKELSSGPLECPQGGGSFVSALQTKDSVRVFGGSASSSTLSPCVSRTKLRGVFRCFEDSELKVYCDLSDVNNPKSLIYNNFDWEWEVNGHETGYDYDLVLSNDPPFSKDRFELLAVSF